MDALDLLASAPDKGVVLTKDAIEHIFLLAIADDKIDELIEELREKGLVREKDVKEVINKNGKEREKVEIKGASHIYEAKEYEGKVEDVWKINVDFEGKTEVENFVKYFRHRYKELSKMFSKRRDVQNLISLSSLASAKALNEEVTIIAIIREKTITKNGNVMLLVEDETGEERVIIPKDVYENGAYVLPDDVVALKGRPSQNFFIVSEVIYPDIPLPLGEEGIGKIKEPLNAVFISDLHFGSKNFIYEVRDKFMKWLTSKDEDARKVKYLFILGDNVDGVGVYPNQELELEMANIYDQYKAFESFLLSIPEHIEVIIIPGNHDAVRLAEPQPALPEKYLPNASQLKNIHLFPNPSFVNIHNIDTRGVGVLMYHGYAFNGAIDELEHIRKEARHKPTLVMKELLKRRHLAPLYGSTVLAPKEEDIHIIKDIPDIFVSGDLHSHDVSNYRGVTLISASTWQSQTSFQDRVGHVANPGKVTLVELNTRNVKVFNFYDKN